MLINSFDIDVPKSLKTYSNDLFLLEQFSNEYFGEGRYLFGHSVFEDYESPIEIYCSRCDRYFFQKPKNHLKGNGCSRCQESKGEIRIQKYLIKNNYEKNKSYFREYSFDDLKFKDRLYFDFMVLVNDNKILLEYNGEDHYKIVGRSKEFKKNLIAYLKRVHCDLLKTKYCEDKNLKLVTIPYWDYKLINDILSKELF